MVARLSREIYQFLFNPNFWERRLSEQAATQTYFDGFFSVQMKLCKNLFLKILR